MNASWYEIRDVKANNATISITDEIGIFGITAASFINQLKSLGNRRVSVEINSPGGAIFEGNSIFNALRQHSAGVDTSISALAASMASVIAMAGESRSIAENGMFMIHNPWKFTAGESKDLKRDAQLLEDLKSSIITTYAGATGLSREDLSKMMDDETWLTSQEALDFGFVTEISPAIKASASYFRFDIRQFENCPKHFMAKKLSEPKNETEVETPVDVPPAIAPESSEREKVVVAVENSIAENSALKAENSALKVQIESYKKEIIDLGKENAVLAKERDDATLWFSRLEKVQGLSPAQVIVNVPASEAQTPFEIWSSIKDDAQRTVYYNKHRDEILPFSNKPQIASE